MPRTPKQSPIPAAEHDPEQLDRLIDAVDSLTDQVRVLRDAIDDFRDDFAWAIRNDRLRPEPVAAPIISMPLDPLAVDFGERVKRRTPEEPPPEPTPEPPPAPAPAAPAPSPPEQRPAGRRREPPLWQRIYGRKHVMAVVQIIGYEERPLAEVQEALQPLIAEYGKKIKDADDLVVVNQTKSPATIRLKDEVKKIAFQLLGPPPAGSHT